MSEDWASGFGAPDLSTLVGDEAAHVLHVDDDRAFLELAESFLTRFGLTVSTAEDPGTARERLETESIDCVVSDYEMPGENGIEVLRFVREDHPKLPFILFTGRGSEEVASEAISAGVTDYLQKETGTEQWRVLANCIENLVERRRSERLVEYGFTAMETAREGISLLDEDGHFVYVNHAYADVVEYDREELVGAHWELLYPAEDIDTTHDEIIPEARREGEWAGENVYLRKDGSEVVVDHVLSSVEEDVLICLIRSVEGKSNADGS